MISWMVRVPMGLVMKSSAPSSLHGFEQRQGLIGRGEGQQFEVQPHGALFEEQADGCAIVDDDDCWTIIVHVVLLRLNSARALPLRVARLLRALR